MLYLVDFDSGIDFVDEVKGSVESNCSSKQPKGYDHHKRVRKVKQGRPIKKKKKKFFFFEKILFFFVYVNWKANKKYLHKLFDV